jgi:hypothetical protein
MRARRVFSWRWVALGGAAVACGGNDDGGHAAPPIGSVEEFVARSNEAYCAKLRECCSAEELADHALGKGSVEECAAALDGAAAIFRASLDAGRAAYDPNVGGSCVEAYANLSCDDPRLHTSGSLASCEHTLRPLVAMGERCEQPYECAGGSCDFEMGGLCVPIKANGELCLTHHDCESNYCDPFAGCADAPATDASLCR